MGDSVSACLANGPADSIGASANSAPADTQSESGLDKRAHHRVRDKVRAGSQRVQDPVNNAVCGHGQVETVTSHMAQGVGDDADKASNESRV